MTETSLFGRLEGKSHFYPLSVFYEDTDAGGIVYHSNYLNFAERARTGLLRCHGLTNRGVAEQHNIVIAVRKAEIDFLRAARLEDELEVETRLVHVGGASLRMRQTIRRGDEVVCDILVILVSMSLETGGAARLPEDLADLFKTILVTEDQES